jgi:hypothetical protein
MAAKYCSADAASNRTYPDARPERAHGAGLVTNARSMRRNTFVTERMIARLGLPCPYHQPPSPGVLRPRRDARRAR